MVPVPSRWAGRFESLDRWKRGAHVSRRVGAGRVTEPMTRLSREMNVLAKAAGVGDLRACVTRRTKALTAQRGPRLPNGCYEIRRLARAPSRRYASRGLNELMSRARATYQ